MKTIPRLAKLSCVPLLFLGTTLFAPSEGLAQGAIAGTVRDSSTLAPLAAVLVRVVDGSQKEEHKVPRPRRAQLFDGLQRF